mmetsp:Transcript_28224/g.74025  ORF Transcript_28224/g.74025 Transcript_28224/m.74025 type:complete len:516 (+) Transcript_28224:319-1866(+)
MGLTRKASTRRQYQFYSQDQADYDRQKRHIEMLFGWFGVLSFIDLVADLNMLVAIHRSLTSYSDFMSSHLEECASTCTDATLCYSGAPCNQSLCKSVELWQSERSADSCKVDRYTGATEAPGGGIAAAACDMLDRDDGYNAGLASLTQIRLAYAIFFAISVLLTLYYIHCLWKKFQARLALIPPVLHKEPRVVQLRDRLDKPYFAPPTDDFPGRIAAPYYRPETAAAKVDKKAAGKDGRESEDRRATGAVAIVAPQQCHGCKLRDEAGEIYCRVCGAGVHEEGGIHRLQMEQATARSTVRNKAAWHYQYRQYLQGFISTSGVRFLTLTLEDMPQAIIIIMFVVTIDRPDGLACMECSTNGELCQYGDSYPKAAIYLVLLGQLGSVALLCVQVLYLKSLEAKDSRDAYSKGLLDRERHDFTWCGIDLALLFVMIPAFIAPVLITILVTDMRLILDIETGSPVFIAVVVLAVVFSLPWVVLTLLTTLVIGEQCGVEDCDCCGDCCETCGDCVTCCCG